MAAVALSAPVTHPNGDTWAQYVIQTQIPRPITDIHVHVFIPRENADG